MPFKKPALPTLVTDASWQKEKGKIAKIAGKTGIGPALKKVEAAYKAINWRTFDIGLNIPMGKGATSKAAGDAFKAAQAEYMSNVEGGLRKTLIAARDLASKTATSWEKNKLIPKSSVQAAQAVAKAADHFMVAVNKNSMLQDIAKDYKDNLAGIAKNEALLADNAKRLKLYCVQVIKGIKSIKTASEFNGKYWSESIRGVGTTLPPLSVQLGIVSEHKTWRKFTSEDFKPTTDEEVPEKLKAMAPVLQKIAAAAATIK